jgi:hypothetical protein
MDTDVSRNLDLSNEICLVIFSNNLNLRGRLLSDARLSLTLERLKDSEKFAEDLTV